MMQDLIKTRLRYREALLTAGTILLLTVFCRLVGYPLTLPLMLLLLGVYLFLRGKGSLRCCLRLGLLLALLTFGADVLRHYTTIPPVYLPVATVSMLTMLLFSDLELSLVAALAAAVIAAEVLDGPAGIPAAPLFVIFFIGGLAGAFSVGHARTRGRLFAAGLFVGALQAVAVILAFPDVRVLLTPAFLLGEVRPLFVNGLICTFVVTATLKIFESCFGVLTNFSLLELSDFNHPLLKRMIMEAPGTYHHSLVVSNIAEAAADAIGANSLLTRVGSYYHDIGKMVKPEYFTENQIMGGNKHDDLEPSISRLVILNHVKEGVELARRYKLNPLIQDFILQHHGTSLMYYFYQKALEESPDAEAVKAEQYRYPGPKPQTRETAIVLLADSAEAATRSLKEPTPIKIEEMVRKVINNKFIDGQLDDCNLTLREIDRIARTFTRVLSAMYHGRVGYPEKKNGTTHHRDRSSEGAPPEPRPGEADRPQDPGTGRPA